MFTEVISDASNGKYDRRFEMWRGKMTATRAKRGAETEVMGERKRQ